MLLGDREYLLEYMGHEGSNLFFPILLIVTDSLSRRVPTV